MTFIPVSYALQNSVQMTRREKVFSFVEWAEAPLNLMGFPLFSEVSVQTAGQEIFFPPLFADCLSRKKTSTAMINYVTPPLIGKEDK